MSITIFYTTSVDGPRLEHDVPNKEAGLDWIDGMVREHPAFCITGTAIHRVNTSFGCSCAPHPLRLI